MPELVLHRRVRRYVRRLPGELKEKIKESLAKLAEDPENYPGAITMSGRWQGYHRIRIGNLRVVYCFRAETGIIYVDYLGPRGEIYKQ